MSYQKEINKQDLEKLASNLKRIEEIIKDYIGAYKEINEIYDDINNMVATAYKLIDAVKGNISLSNMSIYKLADNTYTVYLCFDRVNKVCISKDFNGDMKIVDVEKAMIEIVRSRALEVVITIFEYVARALDRLDIQVLSKLINFFEKNE